MAYSPRLLGKQPPLSQIGEKLAKTLDILAPYVTGPFDAFWRLAQSPAASGGAFTEQNAEDALIAGGGPIAAGSVVPKPKNALNMGIRAYHGSPHSFDKFEKGRGKTARDIYLTPFKDDASHYGKNVYEVDVSGNVGDFTPDMRGPKEVAQLQSAYEGGLGDYFSSFDEFLEAFDSGDMYQRFANQYAQNDTIANLLYDASGNRRFDAVRIPDAGFGGGLSESIVTDNTDILSIVRKYGIAGASAMLGYNLLSNVDKAQADTLKKADIDYRYSEWLRQGGI